MPRAYGLREGGRDGGREGGRAVGRSAICTTFLHEGGAREGGREGGRGRTEHTALARADVHPGTAAFVLRTRIRVKIKRGNMLLALRIEDLKEGGREGGGEGTRVP